MTQHRVVTTLTRISPRACRALAYFTALSAAGAFLYHIARGSNAYLGLFEDDFFYYAVIADRFVEHGNLAFDGIHATNGFHPLWFLVILVLRVLTGGVGTAFFTLLFLLFAALLVASYEALRVLSNRLGTPDSLAAPLAALQLLSIVWLVTSGMEVAIAVPLFTLFLAELARPAVIDPRRAVKLGFLASLVVLARLDLALAMLLLGAGWLLLARPRSRVALETAGGFALGGSPLAAYFVWNRLKFGHFLPTSAMAKGIRTASSLNLDFLRGVWDAYGLGQSIVVGLGVAALFFIPRSRRPEDLGARLAVLVALGFPFLFYLVNVVQSSWCFFSWYSYPRITTVLVACVLTYRWLGGRLAANPKVLLAGVVALTLMVLVIPVKAARFFLAQGPRWTVEDNTLTDMAIELAGDLRGRNGMFAMGDKAGVATFLLHQPVVQLEGLVAGPGMLEDIRREESLDRVVDQYGIDYLIVSLGKTRLERRDGCYVVVHPNPDQAGADSAKMRARICEEPFVHFETPSAGHYWSRYLPLETFVFDLRGEKRRAILPL